MLQTFEAKLTGNQLEWIDEIPRQNAGALEPEEIGRGSVRFWFQRQSIGTRVWFQRRSIGTRVWFQRQSIGTRLGFQRRALEPEQ